MQAELEWVRANPKGRQAKSKARLAAYEKMAAEGFKEQQDEFEIQIPPGKNLGDLVINADNISKGFGDHQLIDNLTFQLPPGGIVGVIGANGAGKTTVIKMLTGLLPPTSGTGSVAGARIGRASQAIRERIGYMSQSFSLYEELTVRANLELHARLYRVPKDEVHHRVDPVVP